jgi:hypothetical protein
LPSTIALLRNRAVESRAPGRGPAGYRIPTFTVIDCFIDNCRVGIHMEGGHGRIHGLTVLNTPVAIELEGGATVEAHRVYHSPGPRRPAA